MVMPRSRSSSFESITRSTTASLARNVPLWRSMALTRVVLPWSTCAMIAMLRIPEDNGVPSRREILLYLLYLIGRECEMWSGHRCVRDFAISLHSVIPERSEGPMYLTALVHRSFALLRMTVNQPVNY